MGERTTGEPPPGHRLTVAQAAVRLGISEGAVRSRIKRGTIPTERVGGTVYVVLVSGEPSADQATDADEPPPDNRLIQSYEARIEFLERQLEEANVRDRENRRIIAVLTQRIPELEPPRSQEQPGEPQSASEGSGRGDVPAGPEKGSGERAEARPSLWRRLFGG